MRDQSLSSETMWSNIPRMDRFVGNRESVLRACGDGPKSRLGVVFSAHAGMDRCRSEQVFPAHVWMDPYSCRSNECSPRIHRARVDGPALDQHWRAGETFLCRGCRLVSFHWRPRVRDRPATPGVDAKSSEWMDLHAGMDYVQEIISASLLPVLPLVLQPERS